MHCRYIAAFYAATARELRRVQSTARSKVYAHFAETTDGSTSVRAFGLQQTFCSRLEAHVAELQRASITGAEDNWLQSRLTQQEST
jgi:ATP-binding cassette, subfamily C (CFTR/MRP), member 10